VVYNNAYYDQTVSKWFPANQRYNIERYSGVELAEMPAVENSYDLVWCGRFHAQKGLDQIPEIVELLKERKPDIRLAVIGSGAPWEERLRREIERRGLQRNIELKGFLEGPEKFAVFKSARIFLMTSLYESFGQVILEAMKCGLPVVAYDLPVYEVFKAGIIRVDPLDNAGMCAEILGLLSNDDNYAALAEAAIHFAQQFSWSITADEISKLISD